MSLSLLWRTDVHYSDHTPRRRVDKWTDTVSAKLEEVGEIARRRGVHAVLDGGDFFDIKTPTRNSHSLVRRAIEIHKSYPCPVYANVGNHDCVYGDYKYLPQQPLGVLFESGVFRRLYDEHEAVFERDGVKVRVVGIPYHGVKYDYGRFDSIRRGDETYLVVVCHLLASPTETTLFDSEDVVLYSTLDKYPVDLWFFGHWHQDQGVTKLSRSQVVNIGSLTRGSLSQDNLTRSPSVCLAEFRREGISLEVIPITHKPSSEIFDLEAKDLKEVREESLDHFAQGLSLIQTRSSDTLRDKIHSQSQVPNDVREKSIHYVELAEGSLGSKK